MTRHWYSSLSVFILFLVSVYSIQNSISQEFNGTVCSKNAYSCITTSECAERHSGRGIDEVLFHCDGKKKICCPPLDLSKFDQSEQICTRSSCKFNRPYTENPVTQKPHRNEEVLPHNGHNHFQNPNFPNRPLPPSESRRPPQAEQSQVPHQRPPQAEQPQISHQRPPVPSNQGLRPQNSQEFPKTKPQRPQNSQTVPQNPQNQANRPQTLPSQNVPTGTQNVKPSDFSEGFPISQLTSHRNFKLLPTEANCGVVNFANRITEGEEVSLGEYPWMVLTGLKDRYGNYRWNCGGTLINGRYVLTAAHCVHVFNRTIEYVRLGEHSLVNDTDCYKDLCLEQPEDVTIEEVIPHEKWNTTTLKNDIALLRLSRNPLTSGKSNIYPICLPFDIRKLNLTSTTKYAVAGWGKTDWNADEGSDVLRKASISGVNHEECNICKGQKKPQYCPITDSQLCVQGWKSVDVCKGDSGGPLMVTRLNIYQVGITSFKSSENCGAENIPSIFTRVESFLPWILDTIRE